MDDTVRRLIVLLVIVLAIGIGVFWGLRPLRFKSPANSSAASSSGDSGSLASTNQPAPASANDTPSAENPSTVDAQAHAATSATPIKSGPAPYVAMQNEIAAADDAMAGFSTFLGEKRTSGYRDTGYAGTTDPFDASFPTEVEFDDEREEPEHAVDAATGSSSFNAEDKATGNSEDAKPEEPERTVDAETGSSSFNAEDKAETSTARPKRAKHGSESPVSADGSVRWVDIGPDDEPPADYPIKANVNSGLYHEPGDFAYERTHLNVRCYNNVDYLLEDGYRHAAQRSNDSD